MDVVRHDNVATDSPAVTCSSSVPFINQNCGDIWRSQKVTAAKRAGRNKINRVLDPDSVQPVEVTMHATF